ncbi:MAG: HAMP domain-containing histidine kinase [Verrucomicrobia bacterium]|nr:HAMP domain-containing histidine kinase [Verrucomicrobiota bacterium]
MNRVASRTVLAFLLITTAIAVPSVSWFMAYTREVALEAAQIEETPRLLAESTAQPLADRVAARLEALREAESRRPFYHYQHLCHDPKGASEGAAVFPSPLAEGSADPLVWAHFQIDAAGRLTLPTLSDTSPDAAQRALRDELQPASPACLALLREHRPAPAQMKSETMDAAAYEQNLHAARIYADIKSGKAVLRGQQTGSQAATATSAPVQIHTGPFLWHTVSIGDQPRLMALREVRTSHGGLAQGFVIEAAAMADLLKRSRLPAQFLPGAPAGPTEAAVAVKPAAWRVCIDPRGDIAEARANAVARREEFMSLFLQVVLVAVFVDLWVVALVWQSEHLAQQRSQFAASAAHALRTPLAGLRMYAEMLAEGLGDPARARDYAQRIAGEVERLARVVANVLGFSRLERGKISVRPEPGDLAAAVRASVARQQPALVAAGARVELVIADDLPPARFDRDALTEILQNLLDNAEKYTRAAGDRSIRVALAPAGAGVALSVAEHGPGLPPEVRRRLFRPFARGVGRDTPAGLGLGLAIVRTLARAQAATVDYEDATGGGAVFTVTFPSAAA